MARYCVILALCLYIPTVLCLSEEMQELITSLHNTCVEETGATEEEIGKIPKEKKFSEDEKFKCYVKCLMDQMGCMSDSGTVDIEAMIAVLPDDLKAAAEPLIRACGPKVGANACESAWLTHKCFFESNPDVYPAI